VLRVANNYTDETLQEWLNVLHPCGQVSIDRSERTLVVLRGRFVFALHYFGMRKTTPKHMS